MCEVMPMQPAPFQSTLPARGATSSICYLHQLPLISIHAPRTGSDMWRRARMSSLRDFNPRSPHGERLNAVSPEGNLILFQSTLPARGATGRSKMTTLTRDISIHAPRTGSDVDFSGLMEKSILISIHAPRTGSDNKIRQEMQQFQQISIHAPRTGSDALAMWCVLNHGNFNPRSPHGERLGIRMAQQAMQKISIHAPRTGSDPTSPLPPWMLRDFNPRSPHGERRTWRRADARSAGFQSTLPARGATIYKYSDVLATPISIHAPRTGSDAVCGAYCFALSRFQSTLPARGATGTFGDTIPPPSISIHAPRTGSDCAK